MGSFLQDINLSYRFLKGRFGFTITACLTLALGIGANAVVFSVMHALLIKPLPIHEPERLVVVHEKDLSRRVSFRSCSTRMFVTLRDRNTVFTHLTAWYERETNVGGLSQRLQVVSWQTTADFFRAMGLKPILGRTFYAEETRIGNPEDVAVIGHRFWRQQFNADPSVLGRTILVDDRPTVVVGVMPPNEQWLEVDLLIPLPPYVTTQQDRPILTVVGRLKPGQTIDGAEAQLAAIAGAVRPEFRGNRAQASVGLLPIDRAVVDPNSRRIVWLLSGTVLLVLCIAGVNVTNLLMASVVGRRREMALQTALGAGRFRLVRRLVTESVMLAVLGGSVGILVALWGVDGLRSFGAAHIPRLDAVRIGGATLLFAAILAIVTGLATGLVPAIRSSRPDIIHSLKEATESGFGAPARQGLRGTLVVVEVALTLALLIAAGLLLRSVMRISNVDPGFQTTGRMAITVNLPRTRYEPDAMVLQFWRSLMKEVGSLPGVISATGTSDRWLVGQRTMEFDAEDQLGGIPRIPAAQVRTVTPGYFKTLGIRILEGRDFSDQDWLTFDDTAPGGAPPVTIVSKSLAWQQWPGEQAIGKKIRPVVGNQRPWCTVIGVVDDVRQISLTEPARPFFYLPEFQFAWPRMYLVVHTSGEAKNVLPGIQGIISRLDPGVPVNEIVSLDDLRTDSQYVPRALTFLVAIFAGMAVALAAVGVYGLLACSVAWRTHEFGIRLALGAGPSDITRLVVRQGLKLIIVGEAAGLGLAVVLALPLRTQLYEVSPTDPLTYATVTLFLLLVAVVACLIPSYRATRIEPSTALRMQ